MHRQLLKLLHEATGQSCHVIAVFLDIRGFTSFSGSNESTDAAAFLRVMYSRIIDEYFPDPLFFKPTGDGLMVIIAHPDKGDDFVAAIGDVLRSATRLVDEFEVIADKDMLVNFAVPSNLGIGVARGSVTRLASGEFTLDYTGRCLNLAARLMDLARPKGVVFHDKFASDLIPDDLAEMFCEASVFIKGVAEIDPISVRVTSGITEVPLSSMRPIIEPSWYFDERTTTITCRSVRDGGLDRHACAVSLDIYDPGDVYVAYSYPASGRVGSTKVAGTCHDETLGVLEDLPSGKRVMIVYSDLYQLLRESRVKLDTEITLRAKYKVL